MNTILLSFNALAVEIPVIIFIILLVGGVVAWQVVKRVRAKKSGSKSSSCGCGCSGCSMAGSCPAANANKKHGDDDDAMPDIPVQSEVTCDFSDLVK